ncbi:transposable element Tc3 transposase [Trichonephila clavipes]|nr:transposable element Tc3 transposase [Trichonephila clavipes]
MIAPCRYESKSRFIQNGSELEWLLRLRIVWCEGNAGQPTYRLILKNWKCCRWVFSGFKENDLPPCKWAMARILEVIYGTDGWLVWGGIILGSRTDLHVQSVTITGHIYQDVILEQHVHLFLGAMGAEFLFIDDNARPHQSNIVDECLQSEDITRMDWPAYSPDVNPVEHVWDMLGRRIAAGQPPPT